MRTGRNDHVGADPNEVVDDDRILDDLIVVGYLVALIVVIGGQN